MRNIVFKITTLLYKILYMLTCKHIKLRGSLYAIRIDGNKSNSIDINNELSHSNITIDGNNNCICSHGIIRRTNIKIIGNNNSVSLEHECIIQNSTITIRANNASFVIGKKSNILSGIFICQGHNNYIHIGDNCLFSANVELWNSDTHTIFDDKGKIINQSKPIIVGDHVWIGKHAKILKGVTIGENAVIGMCSVVSKNIEPNTINAGIPCKQIKKGINWDKALIME